MVFTFAYWDSIDQPYICKHMYKQAPGSLLVHLRHVEPVAVVFSAVLGETSYLERNWATLLDRENISKIIVSGMTCSAVAIRLIKLLSHWGIHKFQIVYWAKQFMGNPNVPCAPFNIQFLQQSSRLSSDFDFEWFFWPGASVMRRQGRLTGSKLSVPGEKLLSCCFHLGPLSSMETGAVWTHSMCSFPN